MSSEFQTKTELEILRRLHALTLKVMAVAFLAITLLSVAFAGAVAFMAQEQTKQIQALVTAGIEVETTRETTVNANPQGNSNAINQTVGK